MLEMTVGVGGAPEREVWWQGKVKNYGSRDMEEGVEGCETDLVLCGEKKGSVVEGGFEAVSACYRSVGLLVLV